MWKLGISLVTTVLSLCAPIPAQGGELFERVVRVLKRSFYDREFRKEQLPQLAERYRAAASRTRSLEEERIVVHAMLREIPATHLALYSKATHQSLLAQIFVRQVPTFGFELEQRAGRFYAVRIWDGGPAARAGLLEGDRVLAIDDVFPGKSQRLDWRSDDAHLDDPPVHSVLVGDAPQLSVRVERGGRPTEIDVEASPWGSAKASKASQRIVERDGKKIGYLHLWTIFSGSSDVVRRALRREFRECDAIVLDLRGRGGSGGEAMSIIGLLRRHVRDGCPIVAIIDGATRSAKEVIASEIKRRELGKLVGRKTAGAVIPASFAKVGSESVLMYPSMTLGKYTEQLELVGVEPDVVVARGDLIERALAIATRQTSTK